MKTASTMRVEVFCHYISCLQWNPWYIKILTNREFPLCLLASFQFFHFKHFFLIDGIFTSCSFFFISRSIKILLQFFIKRRMIKIVHDCNKVFNKKVIYFLLFLLIVFLFENQMHIFLNLQFFYGVCYRGNCLFLPR